MEDKPCAASFNFSSSITHFIVGHLFKRFVPERIPILGKLLTIQRKPIIIEKVSSEVKVPKEKKVRVEAPREVVKVNGDKETVQPRQTLPTVSTVPYVQTVPSISSISVPYQRISSAEDVLIEKVMLIIVEMQKTYGDALPRQLVSQEFGRSNLTEDNINIALEKLDTDGKIMKDSEFIFVI